MANLILVGVDGSDTSMAAGRRAAELAVTLNSKLFVLTAFHLSVGEVVELGRSVNTSASTSEFVAAMRNIAASAETTANRAAEELRKIAPDVEAGTLEGSAGDALLDEAKRLEASLIVVGNRNMQGAKRMLGSVPNLVSHNAPCDVYIVKTV